LAETIACSPLHNSRHGRRECWFPRSTLLRAITTYLRELAAAGVRLQSAADATFATVRTLVG